MGCIAGKIPGAPKAPVPDAEKVTGICKEHVNDETGKDILEKYEEICAGLRGLKNDDEEYEVEDCIPAYSLKKDADEGKKWAGALLSVLGTKVRDTIKEKVWEQLEPELAKQLEENAPDAPEKLVNAAMKQAEKATEKLVDTAIDKLAAVIVDALKKKMAENKEE